MGCMQSKPPKKETNSPSDGTCEAVIMHTMNGEVVSPKSESSSYSKTKTWFLEKVFKRRKTHIEEVDFEAKDA